MPRLEGKVALISGGARGQGACEGRLFAQEGAKVVLTDILDEEGEAVAAEIRQQGGDAIYVRLDVTQEQQWQDVIQATVDRYGKLDILVNNAGIFPMVRVEDTSVELWEQVMDINVTGVFLGTKHAIPVMRAAGEAPSSTSRLSPASSVAPALPPTAPLRARCASSPRAPPSSTPPTAFAPTPSTPASSSPR